MRISGGRARRPHEVAAQAPALLMTPALVRNLAEIVGGDAVYCAATETGLAAVAAWPPRPGPRVVAPDLAAAAATPGVAAVEPVPGGGGVLIAKAGRVTTADRQALRETAVWLSVAARLDLVRAGRDRAAARAETLSADLRDARARLAQVRDLERRRLVTAISAVAGRGFGDVRARADDLRAAAADPDAALAAVGHLRDALDSLLDTFRTVVRGVHPAMLPDRGPRAALEELAATLPRAVRFAGDLGRRVGWEVESGLYHAAAAVLGLVAGRGDGSPVSIDFARTGGDLRVVITAVAPDGLADALADDAERIAVLGGAMECSPGPGGIAAVTIRLPERIGAPPEQARDATLVDAVRGLLEHGWQSAPDRGARDRWAAVAERLRRPPRLAVVGGPRTAAAVGALIGVDLPSRDHPTWYVHGEGDTTTGAAGLPVVRLPAEPLRAMSVLDLPTPLDADLAAALPAGPDWAVDAVLCLAPPAPWLRTALLSTGHRVLLIDGARFRPALALAAATMRDDELRSLLSPAPAPALLARLPAPDLAAAASAAQGAQDGIADAVAAVSGLSAVHERLARGLLVRADVVVARRALVDATALVRGLPSGHPLQWSVERVRAGAHDIAELDLLDDLDRGAVLLGERHADALRLLGVHGADPRTRLGLLADAPDSALRAAAQAAADHWRAAATRPSATAAARTAAEILVRTCEGVIVRIPSGA